MPCQIETSQIEKPRPETPPSETPKTETPQIEMPQIENLKPVDPFADAGEVNLKSTNKIHIRAQQTSGPPKRTKDGKRRPHMVTTISGLPDKFDRKKIVKFLKNKWACAGKVVGDKTWGEVILIQGDLREKLEEFLTAHNGLGLSKELVIVHG